MKDLPSKPERPVTIRDIAAAAEVHPATVSRALRNDKSISAPVRQTIQELAQRMDYRPNPLVAAFTAQVRNYRGSPKGASIAYLQYYETKPNSLWQSQVISGLEIRARQLGYHLECIRFGAVDESTERLSSVLAARGTRGLVVLPVPSGFSLTTLACEGLALAAVGISLKQPAIHRVATDFFQNMTLMLRTLVGRGYRRIGFGIAQEDLDRFGERWLGAYMAWQMGVPIGQRVPVHVNPHLRMSHSQGGRGPSAEWSSEARRVLERWLGSSRPDVVIGSSGAFYRGLRLLGVEMPMQLGYAGMGILPELPDVAGVDQNHQATGAAAVDLVVGQMHRNDYGIPCHPATLLIQGDWVEGATVRQI